MNRKRHPELEGYPPQPLYTFELKNQKKTFRNRLFWTSVGLFLGIGLALGTSFLLPVLPWGTTQRRNMPEEDPFQQGSNQAMNAAELTQTAEFREDWSRVAVLWQQAINAMQAVPAAHPSHAIAQQKLVEYTRNLNYAQSNVSSRPVGDHNARSYWTTGSNRELVIDVQGMPERVNQFDALCKEVFYYGDSTVNLKNGYVVNYSDLDGNLSVLANSQLALSIQPQGDTWTLGSSQGEVFQVQGTPSRTSSYKETITLHYDDSFVELKEDRVVGYSNSSDNLRVSMVPATSPGNAIAQASWGLGSSRMEVLIAEQKTPTAVKRFDNSCEEVFNFENSSVTFHKGRVTEYANSAQNLNLQ